MLVAHRELDVAADGLGEDEAQLHHARAQRVMRRLVLARRDGLHDEQDHPDEAEAVAQHLHRDGEADMPEIRRHRDGQVVEGRVGHRHRHDQEGHRAAQAHPAGEVAADDAAQQEGRRAHRAVDPAHLLGAQAQAALVARLDQEQRPDGLHLPFGEAEHHDEQDHQPDAWLAEEVRDDLAQRAPDAGRREVAVLGVERTGQRVRVVAGQHEEQHRQQREDHRPRVHDADAALQMARQHQQAAQRQELRRVEERALPPGIGRLLLVVERRHVQAVAGDVVRGRRIGEQEQHRDAGREPHRQLQRHRHQRQARRTGELPGDDDQLLAARQFQERAPQRLERPGQAQQAGPARDLVIGHAHVLEHQAGDQHDDEELHALHEVQAGHPADRRSRGRGGSLRLAHVEALGSMLSSASPATGHRPRRGLAASRPGPPARRRRSPS